MAKPKAAKSSKGQPASSPVPQPPPPPLWPKFKPSLPVVDLLPVPHPRTDKIITVDAFFPRNLCRDYVSFLQTLPLQTTPGKPKRGDAVRVNDRYQIQDAAFATALWEKTGLREALTREECDTDLW